MVISLVIVDSDVTGIPEFPLSPAASSVTDLCTIAPFAHDGSHHPVGEISPPTITHFVPFVYTTSEVSSITAVTDLPSPAAELSSWTTAAAVVLREATGGP